MKTIQDMAREAGWDAHHAKFDTRIEAFAKLVREDERESCAKVCDSFQARDVGMQPAECAGAIRARGKND